MLVTSSQPKIAIGNKTPEIRHKYSAFLSMRDLINDLRYSVPNQQKIPHNLTNNAFIAIIPVNK